MADNSSNGTAPPANEPAADSSADRGPSVRDFLDFDPFEPADAGKATAPSDEPAQPPAGDALPPTDQQTEQPPASAQRAEDPVLRELARINETLAASQQYAAQSAAPQQQPTAQRAAPRFNLEIPQQILKAVIHSEDPEERAMGLAALVNGLANTLYNDISSEFRQQQQQLYQALPQMHSRLSQEQTEQQRAASDFFGRFTALRPTKQMMDLVAGEAKALAVEQWRAGNRNLQWDENFREMLGQRVHASLGLQFPGRGQQPQPPGVPPARQPKRAQFASGGDAKGRNERRAPSTEAQEIWDVFNYS